MNVCQMLPGLLLMSLIPAALADNLDPQPQIPPQERGLRHVAHPRYNLPPPNELNVVRPPRTMLGPNYDSDSQLWIVSTSKPPAKPYNMYAKRPQRQSISFSDHFSSPGNDDPDWLGGSRFKAGYPLMYTGKMNRVEQQNNPEPILRPRDQNMEKKEAENLGYDRRTFGFWGSGNWQRDFYEPYDNSDGTEMTVLHHQNINDLSDLVGIALDFMDDVARAALDRNAINVLEERDFRMRADNIRDKLDIASADGYYQKEEGARIWSEVEEALTMMLEDRHNARNQAVTDVLFAQKVLPRRSVFHHIPYNDRVRLRQMFSELHQLLELSNTEAGRSQKEYQTLLMKYFKSATSAEKSPELQK